MSAKRAVNVESGPPEEGPGTPRDVFKQKELSDSGKILAARVNPLKPIFCSRADERIYRPTAMSGGRAVTKTNGSANEVEWPAPPQI